MTDWYYFPKIEKDVDTTERSILENAPTAFETLDGEVFGPSLSTRTVARGFIAWLNSVHGVHWEPSISLEQRRAYVEEFYFVLNHVPFVFSEKHLEREDDMIVDFIAGLDAYHGFAIWSTVTHMVAGNWTQGIRPSEERDCVDQKYLSVITVDGYELEWNDSVCEHFSMKLDENVANPTGLVLVN